MKTLRFIVMTLALIMMGVSVYSCDKDYEESNEYDHDGNKNTDDSQGTGYDDEYYAKLAGISCTDERFSFNNKGGTILFRVSGGEVTIDIDCGTAWIVENDSEDTFSCTINSSSITIAAAQNIVEDELKGTITLMTAEKFVVFATITVIQDGVAYINLGEEDVFVSSFGRSISVTVESNFDWECAYESDWLTVTKDEKDGSMIITYANNDTENDRECVVTATAGDGAENVAEAELKVAQSWENFDALIFEYTVTGNNMTVELPLYDITNITIDWDDGATSTMSTDNIYSCPSHNYTTPGIYVITVNGTVKTIKSLYRHSSTTPIPGYQYLTAVKQWGNMSFTDFEYAFYKCYNLVSLPEETGDAFANVTSFEYAFYGCSALTAVPENIFSDCVANKTFYYTFYGCESLTAIPENLFSSCILVTTFGYCFNGCSGLTALPENLFSGCSAVTSFASTFSGCESLTTIPENLFSGPTSVKSFAYCFSGCSGLTALPENLFSGHSAVTTFEGCFLGCTALRTVPVGVFDDSFLVTNFSYTFRYCSSVEGESPYTEVDVNGDGEKVKVHLYERGDYAANMRWANPTGNGCFAGSSFSDKSSIPYYGWGGNKY